MPKQLRPPGFPTILAEPPPGGGADTASFGRFTEGMENPIHPKMQSPIGGRRLRPGFIGSSDSLLAIPD